MSIIFKNNSTLDEQITIKTLKNGIKCYVFPKKEFKVKQCIVAYKFGSKDIEFSYDSENITLPIGTAHFLEHKMFEQNGFDVFSEFSKLGGNVNAFTDNNKTAYYFTCNDNFMDNYKLLLNCLKNPYFTDESVKKERTIIKNEIKMYEDNPFYKCHFNLLKALYEKNSIRNNIAGDVNSISDISLDMLYKCHEMFYKPDNMFVVVAGDVDPVAIFNETEKIFDKVSNKSVVRKMYNEKNIYKKFIDEKSNLTTDCIFNIGYKIDAKIDSYALKILIDIIAGEGSPLFNNLYNRGLLFEPLALEVFSGEDYGLISFNGISKNYAKVFLTLKKQIDNFICLGISSDDFKRVKKKQLGRLIRGFNSINAICNSQIELALKDFDLINAFKNLEKLQLDFLNDFLLTSIKEENLAVSVV